MNSSRENTLFAAALSGDLGLLQKLLPAAGDLSSFGAATDMTPLMAAASRGHESVVELLLRHGSSPTRRDASGRSAAAYAREAGHPHLAERLDRVVDLYPVHARTRKIAEAKLQRLSHFHRFDFPDFRVNRV